MKTKTVGIIAIIIGIIMMAYTGFNFITTEKVVDLGAVEINKEKNHPVQWSPYVGLALMFGGIAIVIFGKKKD